MEHTFIMSAEQKAEFHIDEKRAEIRQLAASHQLSTDTIHIVDSDGDVWDTVVGSIPAEQGEEWGQTEPLTPEQIEANEAAELEAKRLAETIKPLAMKQLRAEARKEWADKLKEQQAEILQLRAKLAKYEIEEKRADNADKARLALAQAEIARLKSKLKPAKEAIK